MRTKEKIQPWVADLIQSYGGMYNSPNHAELILDPEEETFFLGCRWPAAKIAGNPVIHLEIMREFEDYFTFINVFPIQDLHDLDYLTPEGLFKLYGMGEMQISAIVEEKDLSLNLIFSIENARTRIKDDETEKVILYSGLLETTEEIILFTRKYINDYFQR